MKVGFIGAGRVGSTAAYTLINNLEIDEIVLVDILGDLAEGEALDLLHASYALDKPAEIRGGTSYSLAEGCELVVVTAGVARKPGMSRMDLLRQNAEIMRKVAEELKQHCGGSVVLVVTNPVDIMTYVLWRETGFPREKVIGMGGALDTSRLRSILRRPTRGLVLGEHGDGMFIYGEDRRFEEGVRSVAMEVIKRKGATIFGPAASIYRMAKAILTDSQEILPSSVVLEGEYGLRDVAIGVPAKLGRSGIIEIIEIDEIREELSRSALVLLERLREIGY
ncbi:MAG: malate dehydrogenase [Aigarchaeota archaeon]|nr:malate dehydrogenase [Aigarchaeota archaeon]